MTPEERERTMDFILRQQAQFEVNLQREQEERIKDKIRISRVEACVITLTELAEIQSRRLDGCDRTLTDLHNEILIRLDRIERRLPEKN